MLGHDLFSGHLFLFKINQAAGAWPLRGDHDALALDISTLLEEARMSIAAQAATIARQRTELSERQEQIARLRAQPAKLRRMHFGRSSERLHAEITQLELVLEELEQDAARPEELVTPSTTAGADVLRPARLPRRIICPAMSSPTPPPVPASTAAASCAAWGEPDPVGECRRTDILRNNLDRAYRPQPVPDAPSVQHWRHA